MQADLASLKAQLAVLEEEKRKVDEHKVSLFATNIWYITSVRRAGTCIHNLWPVQARVEKDFQEEPEQPVDSEEAEHASKEADSRSVYVGQVDYDCTPEELQRHFQVCL